MKKVCLTLLLLVMLSPAIVSAEDYQLSVDSDELLYGVMLKENEGLDPNAVGDKNLHHKAYGLLQIRDPYLRDVNRIAGRDEVRRRWGKDKLTMQDMKDQEKAKWAFHVYLSHYGDKYTEATGKTPTAEVYARIHNGGPQGWKRDNTIEYAQDVLYFMSVYQKV